MYSTMRSGVKLSIALPDAERGRLRAAVEHNPTALTDTMVQVRSMLIIMNRIPWAGPSVCLKLCQSARVSDVWPFRVLRLI